MKNWKTTLAGILTILLALLPTVIQLIQVGQIDLNQLFVALTGAGAGTGLIAARDKPKGGESN